MDLMLGLMLMKLIIFLTFIR